MKYYSQHGQDFWLEKEIKNLDNKYFVDIGASHRSNGYMSNTLFFEQNYSWNGLLIEPNDNLHNPLKRRKSTLINKAAFRKNTTSRFQKNKIGAYSIINEKGNSEVLCETLNSILSKNNAPKFIDFLSVDTDGYEIDILLGIDFKEYSFDRIIIEHNGSAKTITKMLTDVGYKLIENFMYDLYFCREDFQNKPSCLAKEWRSLPNKAGLLNPEGQEYLYD